MSVPLCMRDDASQSLGEFIILDLDPQTKSIHFAEILENIFIKIR